jgi:hypothetical protein
MPERRKGLRRVTSWLPTYFGFGMTLVGVLQGDELTIEAVDNGPPSYLPGAHVPQDTVYCGDVVTAGSTLVLPDAEHHPCEHFARHKEMQAGWRFYAGVPLTTSGGAVLGSLCIRDTIAHEFRSEDMRVLEALGRETAQGLETNEWPLDEGGAFAPKFRELFVEVMLARTARVGGAGVITTVDSSATTPAAHGLAAVRLGGGRLALVWGGQAGAIPGIVNGTLHLSSSSPGSSVRAASEAAMSRS